jgi:hypothetical protein
MTSARGWWLNHVALLHFCSDHIGEPDIFAQRGTSSGVVAVAGRIGVHQELPAGYA